MIVVGIVGPRGAGKDTLAEHLAKKYNGKEHAHSEILYQILHILHLPGIRENAINLVNLRKVFGDNVLINALNERIKRDNADLEFITGIRFENEFKNIRNYPNSTIIYIDAPVELRFQWHLKNRQKTADRNLSFMEFLELEQRETEIYVKQLGEHADFKIENIHNQEDLFAAGEKIMQQILNKK